MNTRPEIEVVFCDDAAFWGAHDCQYQATFGGFDLDCMVGNGRTPLDAIVDLLDQEEDNERADNHLRTLGGAVTCTTQ
jgi:hypothetical protein